MLEEITKAMKGQAWARAKGELAAISQADFPPVVGGKEAREAWEAKCAKRREIVDRFVQDMEGEELYL